MNARSLLNTESMKEITMPTSDSTSLSWYQQSSRNKPKDMTGQRFGKLTCLNFSHIYNGHAYWTTQCDCGKISVKDGGGIRRGSVTSCGCKVGDRLRTHGQSTTNLYKIWVGLLVRCYNPACVGYPNYGGRGITVCDQWRHSFENFRADMGEKPTPRHSIERRDNNAPYSPENCYWGTIFDQARNRRTTIYLTVDGIKRPLMEWADITGFPRSALVARYNAGWPHKQIISRPLRPDRRRD